MIMKLIRDIMLWAKPQEDEVEVECLTANGAIFMSRHWNTVSNLVISGGDVNDFMDKAKEEGYSCTMKLKVA